MEAEGRLLRLRRAAGRWLLTLKGPARTEGGHKLREESETEVGDGQVLLEVFGALGFEVAWRYEKRRTAFRLGAVEAVLDETPIGDFLELEGPAGATEDAARRLGYEAAGFLDLSYFDLWREAGGSGPLLFGKEPS
jgi:adenylate cyclase class 2